MGDVPFILSCFYNGVLSVLGARGFLFSFLISDSSRSGVDSEAPSTVNTIYFVLGILRTDRGYVLS